VSGDFCCSILVFNIGKKLKHTEIEREVKNIPYFSELQTLISWVNLPLESPNIWVIFFQNIELPQGDPPEMQ